MIIKPTPEDIDKYAKDEPLTYKRLEAINERFMQEFPTQPGDTWENPYHPFRSPLFVETPWRRPENSTSLINMKYVMMVAGLIDDRPSSRMVFSGVPADGPTWTPEELGSYYRKQASIANTLMRKWPGNKGRKMRRLIRRYRKRMGKLAPGPEWIGYYKDYLKRKYEQNTERSADRQDTQAPSAGE